MKTLKDQLLLICESLTTLTGQVKSVAEHIDQLPETDIAQQDAAPKEAPTAARRSCGAKKSKPKEQDTDAGTISGSSIIINTESVPVLATVYDIIKRSRKGVSIDKLRKKTNFSPKQISNALYKLSNKGKIVAQSRGVYIKK